MPETSRRPPYRRYCGTLRDCGSVRLPGQGGGAGQLEHVVGPVALVDARVGVGRRADRPALGAAGAAEVDLDALAGPQAEHVLVRRLRHAVYGKRDVEAVRPARGAPAHVADDHLVVGLPALERRRVETHDAEVRARVGLLADLRGPGLDDLVALRAEPAERHARLVARG